MLDIAGVLDALIILASVVLGLIATGWLGTMAAFRVIDEEMRDLGFVIPHPTLRQQLCFWLPKLHRIPLPSLVFALTAFDTNMRITLVSNMFEIVWRTDNMIVNADTLSLEPGAYNACLQRVLARTI